MGVFYLKTFSYIFIMIQENETLSVRVDMTYADGKFNFQLFTDKEKKIETVMLRAILVGGVALTIKAEEGPEKQGAAMRETIDYLTSEFISTDSFENAKFIYPKD
jgi:hypothetical protein